MGIWEKVRETLGMRKKISISYQIGIDANLLKLDAKLKELDRKVKEITLFVNNKLL